MLGGQLKVLLGKVITSLETESREDEPVTVPGSGGLVAGLQPLSTLSFLSIDTM